MKEKIADNECDEKSSFATFSSLADAVHVYLVMANVSPWLLVVWHEYFPHVGQITYWFLPDDAECPSCSARRWVTTDVSFWGGKREANIDPTAEPLLFDWVMSQRLFSSRKIERGRGWRIRVFSHRCLFFFSFSLSLSLSSFEHELCNADRRTNMQAYGQMCLLVWRKSG